MSTFIWAPCVFVSSFRETCRQQDRPLFDYLVRAITQHTAGQPAPLLV